MFCPKCGKKIDDDARFCPGCGRPVRSTVNLKRRLIILSAIDVFFFLTLAVVELIRGRIAEDAPEAAFWSGLSVTFAGIVACLTFGIVVGLLIVGATRMFRLLLKRPWIALGVSVGLVAICVGGSYRLYQVGETRYRGAEASLPIVQDMIVDAVVAKIMGDQIWEYVPEPEKIMAEFEKEGQKEADKLARFDVPPLLTDYRDSAIDWFREISVGSEDRESWETLEDQPGDFSITLNDRWAKRFFAESAAEVMRLKEFGDMAVKRQDRDTMTRIAAKLLVQRHWLDGLSRSSWTWPLGYGPAGNTAYAAEYVRAGVCVGEGEGRICLEQILPVVDQLYMASRGYALDPSATSEAWDDGWAAAETKIKTVADASPVPEKTGVYKAEEPETPATTTPEPAPGTAPDAPSAGQPQTAEKPAAPSMPSAQPAVTGAGVAMEAPAPARLPEKMNSVESFFDACHARGGIVGGPGDTKRLPTTESGYTCHYYDQGQTCWDFLTYSGGRYQGGNPGCPEYRLLPATVVEEQAAASTTTDGGIQLNPTAEPTPAYDLGPPPPEGWEPVIGSDQPTGVWDPRQDWDGNYSLTMTYYCSGDAAASGSMGVSLTVSGGVADVGGYSSSISSSGLANFSMTKTVPYEGVTNVITTTGTYAFSREGGGVTVRAWATVVTNAVNDETGETYFVICDNSGSGQRL